MGSDFRGGFVGDLSHGETHGIGQRIYPIFRERHAGDQGIGPEQTGSKRFTQFDAHFADRHNRAGIPVGFKSPQFTDQHQLGAVHI